MQIYYFSRTGRSKDIADQLADRYGTSARKIDDHTNWDGRASYMKAGFMALFGRSLPVDYIEPDPDDDIAVVFPLWASSMPPGIRTFVENIGRERITAVVTSLGGTLKKRDGFHKVIDLPGREISAPESLE